MPHTIQPKEQKPHKKYTSAKNLLNLFDDSNDKNAVLMRSTKRFIKAKIHFFNR